MDLDPPGMDSYSTLIVTMGLSSTINPQCTPRQTDGHAPDNSPTYALMHCMHGIGGLIKVQKIDNCDGKKVPF